MNRYAKYIGYGLIFLAGWMGYVGFNPRYLIFVALASTFVAGSFLGI